MWFTISALLAGAPAATELVGPSSTVGPTEAVSFTLRPAGVAFLDGCAPVELESRTAEGWVAIARKPCSPRPVVTRVEGSLVLSVPPPGPGEYRAVLALGRRCAPDRPFVYADCAAVEVVRSAPFLVQAAPPVTAPR